MNVHCVSLLEQPIELGYALGQRNPEVGPVEVFDRDAGKRQTGFARCSSLALNPAFASILIRLQTENGGDFPRLKFLELILETWIRTD
jgi:hypothetical protein